MSTTAVIILCIVGAGLILFIAGIIYGQSSRPTEAEKRMPMPGDGMISEGDRVVRAHGAITIDAPPEKIWPYFEQMGQQHAGFYSFDWIEKSLGFGINNIYDLRPEWQDNLKPGFFMFFHQNGIGMEVVEVEKYKYFTMCSDSRRHPQSQENGARFFNPFPKGAMAFTWVFLLKELEEGKTRFIMRCDLHFAPRNLFTWLFIGLTQAYPSFIMITGLCRSLKKCAEGRK